jgi:hypothetical protein
MRRRNVPWNFSNVPVHTPRGDNGWPHVAAGIRKQLRVKCRRMYDMTWCDFSGTEGAVDCFVKFIIFIAFFLI